MERGKWEGIGFILDFEDRQPGDVAFILNVPNGEVTFSDLNRAAAAPEMADALVAAKREMWASARAEWTMSDFKNWAVIQQIDAALRLANTGSTEPPHKGEEAHD